MKFPDDAIIGKNVKINVRGKFELGRCAVIGDNVTIECENFEAGEYLFLANGVEIGRGGSKNEKANIYIGDHVGIFENAMINVNSAVIIGDNCGIGAEVMIWTHGAWLDITQGFPSDFGPVIIGTNVWLPARCIVLPNISIGNNVVVGINSLVNKNLPSGCLAAGQPCKVIEVDKYPKPLDHIQLNVKLKPILDTWKENLKRKGIDPHSISATYFKSPNRIQVEYWNEKLEDEDSIVFDLNTMEIHGPQNKVTEDLRDTLRRNGIKFYNGKHFKSLPLCN